MKAGRYCPVCESVWVKTVRMCPNCPEVMLVQVYDYGNGFEIKKAQAWTEFEDRYWGLVPEEEG